MHEAIKIGFLDLLSTWPTNSKTNIETEIESDLPRRDHIELESMWTTRSPLTPSETDAEILHTLDEVDDTVSPSTEIGNLVREARNHVQGLSMLPINEEAQRVADALSKRAMQNEEAPTSIQITD